jgi:hypothetical protein
MIEKQVNVGILAGLAARGRSKQIQVLDAELPEFGLVLLAPGYGLVAFHVASIAEIGPQPSGSISAGVGRADLLPTADS